MVPVYNKLVRDKIPAVIERDGKGFRVKTLDDASYIKELKVKLAEELEEYLQADTDGQAVEELADMLEVIHALATIHGRSFAEVEQIRQKKAEERGGFQEKVFLIDVDDE